MQKLALENMFCCFYLSLTTPYCIYRNKLHLFKQDGWQKFSKSLLAKFLDTVFEDYTF